MCVGMWVMEPVWVEDEALRRSGVFLLLLISSDVWFSSDFIVLVKSEDEDTILDVDKFETFVVEE